MKLTGLEKSLEAGHKLHGFRSGGGLRVICIEDAKGKPIGYGEHPNVEDALSHANEDILAGHRSYKQVYGTLKPHYLTGSDHATSALDHWLLQGKTIDAYVQEGKVVVELRGLAETKIPEDVMEKVKQLRQPVTWQHRGYTFETNPDRFPNGEPSYSTHIIKSPEGKNGVGANGVGADPWMYHIVKTGRGKGFFKALDNAFEAKEVEVTK